MATELHLDQMTIDIAVKGMGAWLRNYMRAIRE